MHLSTNIASYDELQKQLLLLDQLDVEFDLHLLILHFRICCVRYSDLELVYIIYSESNLFEYFRFRPVLCIYILICAVSFHISLDFF